MIDDRVFETTPNLPAVIAPPPIDGELVEAGDLDELPAEAA